MQHDLSPVQLLRTRPDVFWSLDDDVLRTWFSTDNGIPRELWRHVLVDEQSLYELHSRQLLSMRVHHVLVAFKCGLDTAREVEMGDVAPTSDQDRERLLDAARDETRRLSRTEQLMNRLTRGGPVGTATWSCALRRVQRTPTAAPSTSSTCAPT